MVSEEKMFENCENTHTYGQNSVVKGYTFLQDTDIQLCLSTWSTNTLNQNISQLENGWISAWVCCVGQLSKNLWCTVRPSSRARFADLKSDSLKRMVWSKTLAEKSKGQSIQYLLLGLGQHDKHVACQFCVFSPSVAKTSIQHFWRRKWYSKWYAA